MNQMYYVYLLKSIDSPQQRYIGLTQDLDKRIKNHNSSFSTHTNKFKPWEIMSFHAFASKEKAVDFEKYLKTGSGKAFASKRLWT